MTTTIIRSALCVILLALCASAEAQQSTQISRIGYLGGSFLVAVPTRFGKALRELGYIEGKNILVEFRYTEGKPIAIPSLPRS
jgi:putative tryptophan/tyrosine transport system substrate-binding protein